MPMVASETLALVTVTHNSAAELEALLTSIDRHLPGVQIVVVDSASSDETVAVARSARSGARVQTIALDHNVGFGRGCNIGVAAVTQPVTALVNPDVELLDDSLLELAGKAIARHRSGCSRRWCSTPTAPGRTPCIRGRLRPPIWGGCWCRRGSPRGGRRCRSPRGAPIALGGSVGRSAARSSPGPTRSAAWARSTSGSSCTTRTSTSGCARREQGIETWFCPSARVLHRRAHSSDKEFGGEPFELLARARRDVVARRLGPRRAGLDDAAQAATFASRIVSKRLLGRSALRERRQLEALLRVRRADGRA